MFVPHSQKKIKSFHVSVYTLASTITALFLISVVSFTLLTNRSMQENEKSYLTEKQYEYTYQLGALKADLADFLTHTNYRSDLKNLFELAGFIKSDEPILAAGGGEEELPSNSVVDNSRLNEEILHLNELVNELGMSREYLGKLEKKLRARKTFIDNVPHIWPLAPQTGVIIKSFDENDSFNERGLSFDCLPSTPVRATAAGEITTCEYDRDLASIRVVIQHEFGFKTIYSGIGKVEAKMGQEIEKGEVIGYTGQGGINTTGVFRYQIMIANTLVDPEEYISGKY
jgi:murein DD-endopeptidase MepM/ murein hydrolase activator NlpD